MAQTYRALLRAGRRQEAQKLLPPIRSRSLGTEYEFHVDAIIKEANSYQNPAGELDKEFLDLVATDLALPTSQAKWVTGLAKAYGSRITPYLIELIKLKRHPSEVVGALLLGVLTVNEDVVHFGIQDIPNMDEAQLKYLMHIAPSSAKFDSASKDLWVRYLRALVQSDRIALAKHAAKPLTSVALFSSAAEGEIRSILANDESMLAPFILQAIVEDSAEMPTSIIVEQILARKGGIGERLRELAYRQANLPVILRLVEQGDKEAKLMLPAILVPNYGEREKLQRTEFEFVKGANLQNWSGDLGSLNHLPERNIDIDHLSSFADQWKPIVAALKDESDPKLRELGALVALHYEDWELASQFFEENGVPANLGAILFAQENSSMVPYLEEVVNPSTIGSIAAAALLRNHVRVSPSVFARMDPDLLEYYYDGWLGQTFHNASDFDYLNLVLASDCPPEFSEKIARKMGERGGRYRTAAMDFLLKHGEELESPSSLLRAVLKNHSSYLQALVLENGALLMPDIQRISNLIQVALEAKWVDPRLQSGNLASLRGSIRTLTAEGQMLDQAFLLLLDDEELAAKVILEFGEVLGGMPSVVKALVEEHPTLIHERNVGAQLRFTGLGNLELLNHPSFAVRGMVLESVQHFQLLIDHGYKYRTGIQEALGNPSSASSAARFVVRAEIVEDSIPLLIHAWKLKELKDRPSLMRSIGSIYDDRFIPIISEGLRYPDREVLDASLNAQRRYNELRQAQEVSRVWEQSGHRGSPIDFLLEKVVSEQLDVQLAAIDSLATLVAIEALPILVGLMEDKDEQVAAAATAAVKKINAANGNIEEE